MKKKWIWLLLPAALLLLILLHVHSLARLAPSEIGRQVPVLMYHAVGDDCWGEEHLFVRPAKLEQQLQLRALTQSGLVSIQSHGWSHKNMAAMDCGPVRIRPPSNARLGEPTKRPGGGR